MSRWIPSAPHCYGVGCCPPNCKTGRQDPRNYYHACVVQFDYHQSWSLHCYAKYAFALLSWSAPLDFEKPALSEALSKILLSLGQSSGDCGPPCHHRISKSYHRAQNSCTVSCGLARVIFLTDNWVHLHFGSMVLEFLTHVCCDPNSHSSRLGARHWGRMSGLKCLNDLNLDLLDACWSRNSAKHFHYFFWNFWVWVVHVMRSVSGGWLVFAGWDLAGQSVLGRPELLQT